MHLRRGVARLLIQALCSHFVEVQLMYLIPNSRKTYKAQAERLVLIIDKEKNLQQEMKVLYS